MIIHLHNKRLIFSEQVKKVISAYRQFGSRSKEAGGVLLGQISESDIYVCRATIPTNLDKRMSFNFTRSPRSAQMIIDYEHVNSEGLITYLGEWHSHPENDASPSPQDKKMIHDQYFENRILVSELIMLILGRRSDFIGLYDGTALHEHRCFLDYAK